MKTVKALWLKKKEVECKSLMELVENNKYIGFAPSQNGFSQGKRYIIISRGHVAECKGLAVNAEGVYSRIKGQKIHDGDYFIFESAAELYGWLLSGETVQIEKYTQEE